MKKNKGKYRRLFKRKIVCWVKYYPQLIVLEVELFQKPFFLNLSIEAKAVFTMLAILCYEKVTVEYDPWDLAKLFNINPADLQNAVQELEKVYDPSCLQPLVRFIVDTHNTRHLYMPLIDRKVRPMVLRAKDLYRKSGKFARLTKAEKREMLRRHDAA